MINDPMVSAAEEAVSAGEYTYYGKLDVSASYIFFPGNKAKPVPYDATIHPVKKRTTEVSMFITAIDAQNMTRPVERKMVTFAPEWHKIVWPSLAALGCNSLHDANGKYVKATSVETGTTYTNKEGVVKPNTTLRFDALFTSEAEATKAYEDDFGVEESGSQPEPMDEVVSAFLSALITASNGDLVKLSGALAGNPLLSQYKVDSPEVVALLVKAAN